MTVEVVIYGAPACHLCDVAKTQLEELAGPLGFSLRAVDIEGDAELERAYREQIPVVFVAGRKAFKYRIDPGELRRRIADAASQAPP